MKKFVLILLVMGLGLGLNAQGIGLRFGYNMSGLRIDDKLSDFLTANGKEGKMANGMNIGLIFEKAIKPKFDAHFELNYTQKGSAYDMTANEVNHGTYGFGETNFDYLELALMAKFKFGPVYAGIGPFFDYLLSAKEIKSLNNPILTPEQLGVPAFNDGDFYDMNMDEINRFDFGGHLSIGLQFPVGPIKIFGEARGNMSFINWDKSEFFKEQEFDHKRNLAITFSVGVIFNKSSK